MPYLGVCPSCHHERDLDRQRHLLDAEAAWYRLARWPSSGRTGPFAPTKDQMRRLATQKTTVWFWACDFCIASGSALAANVAKQNLGLGTAFAGYVSRPFRCEDCHVETSFKPSEQRVWFETYGFLIWVYPKKCLACRRTRRRRAGTNTALAEALRTLNPRDASELDAVATLYEELGSVKKAAEFRARARNAR